MKRIKRSENRKSKTNRTSQSLSMFVSRLGTTSIEKENRSERSKRVNERKRKSNLMGWKNKQAAQEEMKDRRGGRVALSFV